MGQTGSPSRPAAAGRPGAAAKPGGQARGGPAAGRRGGRPRYYARRKLCIFCVDHVKHIDYKDIERLKRFVSERFKIESRRKSGACAKHQRGVAAAIQRARHLALLPLSYRHRMPGGPVGDGRARAARSRAREEPPQPAEPIVEKAPDEAVIEAVPEPEAEAQLASA